MFIDKIETDQLVGCGVCREHEFPVALGKAWINEYEKLNKDK
jgi:hypothetical protein